MTDPVTIAAAYVLLFGQPTPAPVPLPIANTAIIECQLPPAPVAHPMPPRHLAVVRADPRGGWRHHRHCHRWGRHWRCR